MSKDFKEQLIDHLPRIRKIVAKIAQDENIVDDLTQECCVRIIEKEKLWKDQSKLSQWINAVSRNVTIDLLKKERLKQKKTISLEEDITLPEDNRFSQEHIRWMLHQFGTLNEKQKEILHLKYFKQMKTVDIAEELNISQPAVTQHIQKALSILKKRAKAQGLLSILLPWNWNLDQLTLLKNIFKNKIILWSAIMKTKIITLISITGLVYFGYENMEKSSIIKSMQTELSQVRESQLEMSLLTRQLNNAKHEIATLEKKLQTLPAMDASDLNQTIKKEKKIRLNDISQMGTNSKVANHNNHPNTLKKDNQSYEKVEKDFQDLSKNLSNEIIATLVLQQQEPPEENSKEFAEYQGKLFKSAMQLSSMMGELVKAYNEKPFDANQVALLSLDVLDRQVKLEKWQRDDLNQLIKEKINKMASFDIEPIYFTDTMWPLMNHTGTKIDSLSKEKAQIVKEILNDYHLSFPNILTSKQQKALDLFKK